MQTLRDSGYRALEKLRGAGTVGAIGIGVNEREVLLEALEWGEWDAFLLAGRYTLLEQAPLDDLLAEMPRGGHLDRGRRAAQFRHPRRPRHLELAGPRRRRSSRGSNAIRAVCDRHGVPLAAAALQFPLAHPAVAAIIPGPRTAEEFGANLALLRHPIPAALWQELRQAGLLHPDAPTPA